MSNLSFMENLMYGVEVEWKPLGEMLHLRAGQHISANNIMPVPTEDYVYPCFGGNGIRGFVRKNSHDGAHLLVGRQGALCGNVQRTKGKFYATEHAVVVTTKGSINIDWAFHLLTQMNLNQYASQSAQPGLAVGKIESLKIPIPCPENPKKSLEIQAEIVRILDAFTAHTAELTAELTARKKQYNYYRDKLLSFEEGEVEGKTLGEVYKFQYGMGNTIPTVGGQYPVYGSNGIVGSHHEFNSEDSPVIGHIGAYAGIVNWGEGKHFVTYNGVICKLINELVHPKYAYYQLLKQDFNSMAKSASHPFVSYDALNKVVIPIPPLAEQERIVSILDKFDTLTSSITEGLPREIELRQKQYEYYRDLLLSFPKPEQIQAAT